jgi:hypothetical protein
MSSRRRTATIRSCTTDTGILDSGAVDTVSRTAATSRAGVSSNRRALLGRASRSPATCRTQSAPENAPGAHRAECAEFDEALLKGDQRPWCRTRRTQSELPD